MRRLNVRLLLISLAVVVVVGAGFYFLHRLQSKNLASSLLRQARKAEESDRPDKVVMYLGRYLEFVPSDVEERAKLGRVLASDRFAGSRKMREQAFFNLERVLVREPGREDDRRLLVGVAMELKRFESVKEHLDVLAKAHPDNGQLEDWYGQWYEAQNRHAE